MPTTKPAKKKESDCQTMSLITLFKIVKNGGSVIVTKVTSYDLLRILASEDISFKCELYEKNRFEISNV